jgi:alpha-glucosidase
MPWSADAGGGFTAAGVEPWLPFGDLAAHNVADQRADRGSTLWLTHDLLSLRRRTPDLVRGAYADVTPAGADAAWVYRRGDCVQVVVNLGDVPVTVPVPLAEARVAIASDRVGEGAPVGASVEVEGRRAVVVVAGD